MKITIAAVGRMKAGPERDLVERYVRRAGDGGRQIGLSVTVREFAESRASSVDQRRQQESKAILDHVPATATLIALDETGRALDSQAVADRIGRWRDDGVPETVIAIGGADGHDRNLRQRADLTLAFGSMTWPHQLVRIMLAEQIYRTTTILSGHPYHRA